ncbi:hypothetical protein [Streptomyces sp. NPDC000931]|uniref:hypothetical protein n=1 Tax=Streptomyces sp. NPDC000931 TaxID=3154372 RepID=UPI00331A0B3A
MPRHGGARRTRGPLTACAGLPARHGRLDDAVAVAGAGPRPWTGQGIRTWIAVRLLRGY